ncbi:hypothetical protein TB1_009504 [Malus domestica]
MPAQTSVTNQNRPTEKAGLQALRAAEHQSQKHPHPQLPIGPNFQSASGFSPRHQKILSPSLLEFPSITLSPVTPLNDQFDKSASSPSLGNSSSEEDRAIAEK